MPSGPTRHGVRVHADRAAETAADRVGAGEKAAPGPVPTARADPQLGLGPGLPLPPRERSFFERRLGRDLSDLRTHRDVAAVSELGAHALASGRDIAFAPGQWRPGGADFGRMLGHEIGHTLQQGVSGPAVQLDNGIDLKEAKAEEATGAFEGGLKTFGEAAADNDQLKDLGKGLATRYALPVWNQLSTGEKIGVIGTGAAIYGLGVGSMLGDRNGRKALSDVNIAAPLKLVPYAPLQTLSFVPPASATSPFTLRLGFVGDDYLKLARDKYPRLPITALGFDMTMTIGPDGRVAVPFALAHVGVAPWLDIKAGYGVTPEQPGLDRNADGNLVPYKSFPQPAKAAAEAGTAVFVTIDVLKAPFLPSRVREILGGAPATGPLRDR